MPETETTEMEMLYNVQVSMTADEIAAVEAALLERRNKLGPRTRGTAPWAADYEAAARAVEAWENKVQWAVYDD